MPPLNIEQYFHYLVEVMSTRLRAVTEIVQHGATKGNVGEEVLREVIASFLPARYGVSGGFIIAPSDNGACSQSRQVDLLVYKQDLNVPLYRNERFVVLTPDMPTLAIESKMNMTGQHLEQAVENARSVKEHAPHINYMIWAYKGMGAEALKNALTNRSLGDYRWLPDKVFNFKEGYVAYKNRLPDRDSQWALVKSKDIMIFRFFKTIFDAADVENMGLMFSNIQADQSDVEFF